MAVSMVTNMDKTKGKKGKKGDDLPGVKASVKVIGTIVVLVRLTLYVPPGFLSSKRCCCWCCWCCWFFFQFFVVHRTAAGLMMVGTGVSL